MAALNEKERVALEQFRRNLSDLNLTGENNSDVFLIRWLRARELDLVHSETMLRKSLIWRKENDVDSLLQWTPPANLVEDYPYEIFGHDKDGCPLVTVPFGKHDIKLAVELGQKGQYLKYVETIYERVLDIMRKTSVNNAKPITQFVGVYDMAHLSFRQLTNVGAVDTILESVRRFEANYPETLKKCYIINASRVFTILYSLIKPFLSQRTVDKVQIFASNPTKWKAALLKGIPADQLPVPFGGNSCFILKWYENSNNGIPEGKITPTESDDEDFIAVTVEAAEKLNVEFYIKHPNTTMNWIFKTDYNDIGFSVLYDKSEELVPYERVDSHVTKQTGSLACGKPGRYILCFDNTYSRMTAKTLHYSIVITSPEEDDSDEITNM